MPDPSAPIAYPNRAPTLLIAADSEAARALACGSAAAAGIAVEASLSVDDALARLEDGRLPGVVFVDAGAGALAGQAAASLTRLLTQVDSLTAAGRTSGIVSSGLELIDFVAALTPDPGVQQLSEPTDRERQSAFGIAARPRRAAVRERSGTGPEASQLRALTDEVSRISVALARLAADAPVGPPLPAPTTGADGDMAARLQSMIRARRLRGRFFDSDLFADPAWDMLLDLMTARLEGKAVAVSSLCIAAAVPATTALRWIRMLTNAGLFERRADPADGRRVFIELSEQAEARLRGYLDALARADT